MQFETLKDLFVHQLQDLHNAEEQIIRAFPAYVENAHSEPLKGSLRDHLEDARRQRGRVERILEDLKETPGGYKCEGMEGLLRECEDVRRMQGDPNVRDAALIASLQRVEHYEIAGYGCARQYAEALKLEEAAELLDQSLEEEVAEDEALTEIATSVVHPKAEPLAV